jgi:diaminopimelate epimerase
MSGRAFSKYEGLGNDFVLVDASREDEVPGSSVVGICDRRRGVGADGVILVLPPREPSHAARMRVINADGSVPEMCGNGLRCVALHVARARGVRSGILAIETDAGLRDCRVEDGVGDGALVTVDMGEVEVQGEATLEVDGVRLELTLADVGNPHAVTFTGADRAFAERLGPRVATHPRFPRGTNVEFCAAGPRGIDVVVWERGVGLTLACGTGACAAAAVACAKGLASYDEPIEVRLPGGPLMLVIHGQSRRATMRGPARCVFSGTFE